MAGVAFAGQLPRQLCNISQYVPFLGDPAIKKDSVNTSLILTRAITGVALVSISLIALYYLLPAVPLLAAKYKVGAIFSALTLSVVPGLGEVKRARSAIDAHIASKTAELKKPLDAWASREGGRAHEAVNKIMQAFHNKSFSLSLAGLGLRTQPPGLDKLEHLRELDLSSNDLSSLSFSTVPINLRILRVANNPKLQTLPLLLGQCLRLHDLDTNGTCINPASREHILSMCNANRQYENDGVGSNVVSPRVGVWIAAAENEDLARNLTRSLNELLNESQKKVVNEWLTLLEREEIVTESGLHNLANFIWDMLLVLMSDEAFRQAFFEEMQANLERWRDGWSRMVIHKSSLLRVCASSERLPVIVKLPPLVTNALIDTLDEVVSKKIAEAVARGVSIDIGEKKQIYRFYEKALYDYFIPTEFMLRINPEFPNRLDIADHPDWSGRELVADVIRTVKDSYLVKLHDMPQLEAMAIMQSRVFEEAVSERPEHKKELLQAWVKPYLERLGLL